VQTQQIEIGVYLAASMLLRTFLSNYRIILHTTDINAEKFTLIATRRT
jgi:hypothetical protein